MRRADEGCQMEKITPEKVVQMLKARGMEVSLEEATSILKFLQLLADAVVSQYLGKSKENKWFINLKIIVSWKRQIFMYE